MKILSVEGILKFASYRNKYDLLSNNIARKIFEMIKNNYENKANIKESFYEEIENNNDKMEQYTIDVSVKFNTGINRKIQIDSKFDYPYGQVEPIIDIKILLNKDFTKQDIERSYWWIYDSVRHEYEHFDKYLDNFLPDEEYYKTIQSLDKLNLQDIEKAKLIARYVLNPAEIDSYAKSIMYVAKKRKIPYGFVINDIIERALFSKEINENMRNNKEIVDIMNQIKEGLSKQIQIRYPKVTLRRDF